MKADLHIHSTVSDGSDSIEQILSAAKEKNLDAIAITDHDTISHLAQIPADAGIKVISAVEMSAVHYGTNTRAHILGYNIRNLEIITALAEPLLQARNRNSEIQADMLIVAGFQIDKEKLARADGKYLYKQHIMDWLVTSGQAPDMFGDFYQKTFKQGGICDFDIEYIDVFDAIIAIKEAGGLAVLAHPGQQQNFWLVPELVKTGLAGLELNHHTHGTKDKAIVQDLAKQHGLFLTGGSDYHGKYEPQDYGIGDILSDPSGVEAIC
ncbi:MAG: PHP domain-containing protein [Eubacteriaceae bacterium]|nr:PHP domain-containing protein [Eubacteriaceae bacterium]